MRHLLKQEPEPECQLTPYLGPLTCACSCCIREILQGQGLQVSCGKNSLHAKYQRGITMRATMLISTKKLKSENTAEELYF